MNENGLLKYITPIKMDSITASTLYDDNSLDFVCLDADHSYKAVTNDIRSWYPKIKTGGILGGDDYHMDSVNKSVNDNFKNIKNTSPNDCSDWYVIKGDDDGRVW